MHMILCMREQQVFCQWFLRSQILESGKNMSLHNEFDDKIQQLSIPLKIVRNKSIEWLCWRLPHIATELRTTHLWYWSALEHNDQWKSPGKQSKHIFAEQFQFVLDFRHSFWVSRQWGLLKKIVTCIHYKAINFITSCTRSTTTHTTLPCAFRDLIRKTVCMSDRLQYTLKINVHSCVSDFFSTKLCWCACGRALAMATTAAWTMMKNIESHVHFVDMLQ